VRNDTSLCGAYQFLSGNWLEKQCYADGLLIHYRNSSVGDNNTAAHPGTGMVLPVDAHPTAAKAPDDRTLLSSRWQPWDATFGVDTNQVTLSQVLNGNRTLSKTYTAAPVSLFFDSSPTAYYDAAAPYNSVRTAGSGLKIQITGVSPDRGSYQVRVYR
jgi:immune inhibitor A